MSGEVRFAPRCANECPGILIPLGVAPERPDQWVRRTGDVFLATWTPPAADERLSNVGYRCPTCRQTLRLVAELTVES